MIYTYDILHDLGNIYEQYYIVFNVNFAVSFIGLHYLI